MADFFAAFRLVAREEGPTASLSLDTSQGLVMRPTERPLPFYVVSCTKEKRAHVLGLCVDTVLLWTQAVQ